MEDMKIATVLALVLVWTLFSAPPPLPAQPAQHPLAGAIQQKDWSAVAGLCADSSFQPLEAYFRDAEKVFFNLIKANDLMFFVKFPDHAEIGELVFAEENGRYLKLNLRSDLKPLQFVRSFSAFAMVDRTLTMGDAAIHFKKGIIWQAQPMGNLYVFSGDWEFRIQPSDEEERLTLQALIREDTLKKESQAGVFVFNQPDLLAGLKALPAPSGVDGEECQLLYAMFQEEWGMDVPHFEEKWYFPFSAGFNMALFYKKRAKSHYRYLFNNEISPDTSLQLFPDNKYYLNYNAVKGLKFSPGGGGEELSKINLSLFFNPDNRFLSGSAILYFKEPDNIKSVSLASGLTVKDFGKSDRYEAQLFRRNDQYFLLGENLDKFSLYYSGQVAGQDAIHDLVDVRLTDVLAKSIDHYSILTREQNFYPNPGLNFFKSRLKVSLPHPLLCLASGSLVEQKRLAERNEFIFESPGSKGLSLACGNFRKLLTVSSKIPIQVFGAKNLKLDNYFSVAEIQDYFDFLLTRFGPLDIGELNLLLRRWRTFGGLSNQGFVVFNLLDASLLDYDLNDVRRIRRDSPVVFTDINRDNLIHELAHQWWGGVISWKSYQDQWLTEGLAQFSTLAYLKSTLAEGRYQRILDNVKNWILRKSDSGPMIYGRRIYNLSEDFDAYQSVIYDKSALVFLMLREILGETELLARLNAILKDFKYRSLTSGQFIRVFCREDQRLNKFFRGWVFSRLLPEISYRVTIQDSSAEIVFNQKTTDFVLPLGVRVVTAAGTSFRTVIIENREQRFTLMESAPIQSVEIDPLCSPVRLLD